MKVTNHRNIPDVFVNYSKRNAYDAGGADFTPSSLAEPAMVRHLTKLHGDKITSDISDDLMSILGTAIHSILEVGANAGDIVEERISSSFSGYEISGCPDRLVLEDPEWILQDYKSTSVSTVKHNPNGKPEWVAQLSVYRWLCMRNDITVNTKAEVVCVLRDWVKSQAAWGQDYPKAAVVVIPITLWSYEGTEAYMLDRIKALTADNPAPCTKEERWQGDPKYAVKKYVAGGALAKRASRVLDSSYDAEEYMLENGIHGEVEVRPAKPNRCKDWCDVSNWCKQYQEEIQEGDVF